MVEKIFCPHCKEEMVGVTKDVKICYHCKETIERFTIDSFIEKNIHLFEVIGIFGAIAILLSAVTQGLKEILNTEPSAHQIFALMATLVLCAMLILILWLLVLSKLFQQRKLSPVRKFLSIFGEKNVSIRHGDEQVYLFFIFFAPIYFFLMDYVFTLSTIFAIVVAVPIAAIGILSMIFDHLSKN